MNINSPEVYGILDTFLLFYIVECFPKFLRGVIITFIMAKHILSENYIYPEALFTLLPPEKLNVLISKLGEYKSQ